MPLVKSYTETKALLDKTEDQPTSSKEVDELFDDLADQLKNFAEAITKKGDGAYAIQSIGDLRTLWDKINKELANLTKLEKAEFIIRTGNAFAFLSMYLKAAFIQDVDRRKDTLSGITLAENMGAEESFIRTGYKQLTRRMGS